MLIKGLQKHTLIDYPSRIACTIFLFGCNFRCPYCHNPELVKAELSQEIKTYSEQEILDFLRTNKDFLEGVCITGGEPTMNQELPAFIKKIRQLGYKVKLDTNGTNPDMLKALQKEKLADCIAMDIKAPVEQDAYEKAANSKISIEDIKKSIGIIKKFPEYEFRTTIVPGITSKQDIVKIAQYLKEKGANNSFYLQQFIPKICLNKDSEKVKPYSKEELQELHNSVKDYFRKCKIRNENY